MNNTVFQEKEEKNMNKEQLDDFVETFKEERETITINLLLTEQCNFSCGHCMYWCGPDNDSKYISREVLHQVKRQIDELKEYGFDSINLNLIGGEPTLNLSKFADTLGEVSTWDVKIEMTTNGWWLKSDELIKMFLETVIPYVDFDYGMDGLTIRISDDKYHDEFRPTWLQEGKLKNTLDSIWDEPGVLYSEYRFCPSCYASEKDEDLTIDDDDKCDECDEWLDYEYEDAFHCEVRKPDDNEPWIYVESRKYPGVIAVGRALHWGNINHSFGKGCHLNHGMLTYKPNGVLTDICCRGSWLNTGSVKDDPFVLLLMANQFIDTMRPRCSTCRDDAENWIEDWDLYYNGILQQWTEYKERIV